MLLFAKILTWFQVIMFLIFGVWGFVDPSGLAGLSEIGLPSPLAVAEFRSFYGGSAMAVAVLLILAALKNRWNDALLVQVAVYGSITAGRLTQWASAGSLESQTAKLLATEAVSLALAWWALRHGVDGSPKG
jgi:hypothetical protein